MDEIARLAGGCGFGAQLRELGLETGVGGDVDAGRKRHGEMVGMKMD